MCLTALSARWSVMLASVPRPPPSLSETVLDRTMVVAVGPGVEPPVAIPPIPRIPLLWVTWL